MGAASVVSAPEPTPTVRKFTCKCGRFLGEGTACRGWVVIKCPGCGVWRRLTFDLHDDTDVLD